jgi:hypothetical protein
LGGSLSFKLLGECQQSDCGHVLLVPNSCREAAALFRFLLEIRWCLHGAPATDRRGSADYTLGLTGRLHAWAWIKKTGARIVFINGVKNDEPSLITETAAPMS